MKLLTRDKKFCISYKNYFECSKHFFPKHFVLKKRWSNLISNCSKAGSVRNPISGPRTETVAKPVSKCRLFSGRWATSPPSVGQPPSPPCWTRPLYSSSPAPGQGRSSPPGLLYRYPTYLPAVWLPTCTYKGTYLLTSYLHTYLPYRPKYLRYRT